MGAQRELQEETGLRAAAWREILRLDLSNSITDEEAVCYLATDLTPGEARPDETERLDTVRVPLVDLLQAIDLGQVRDALTVAATLRVQQILANGDYAEIGARLAPTRARGHMQSES